MSGTAPLRSFQPARIDSVQDTHARSQSDQDQGFPSRLQRAWDLAITVSLGLLVSVVFSTVAAFATVANSYLLCVTMQRLFPSPTPPTPESYYLPSCFLVLSGMAMAIFAGAEAASRLGLIKRRRDANLVEGRKGRT